MKTTTATTDWERVITSSPLDKTAATVTARSKDSPPAQLDYERRQDLIAACQSIERAITAACLPEEKKALGQRKLELQRELTEVNAAIGRWKSLRGYPDHFIAVAREHLTKHLFGAISAEARKRSIETNDGEGT